jgi:leucyl-tRNA synthetase
VYACEPQVQGGEISSAQLSEVCEKLVIMLAPFAPYLAAELWTHLGKDHKHLMKDSWWKYHPELAKEEEIEIAIQINGRVRSRVLVSADAPEELVRERALSDEKVKASMDGKQLVKAIVVPGKLVNIVVR